MNLRCLLFSSDEGTAAPILKVLAGLGVVGEHCSEAVATVERVTHESFQIVIIDWDKQPEAGLLLAAARERKAAERPLTLAIVSDDASVPQALQAGANSILRKPLLINQVSDTLTTARDLLRAKQESAANAAMAAAAGASATSASTVPASVEPAPGHEKTLRAGEFLQSSGGSRPGGQFETDSDPDSLPSSSSESISPLSDLEPVASAVAASPAPIEVKPAPPLPPPSSSSNEPRGLQWYLKTRAATLPPPPAQDPAPAPPAPAKPELLGFDQPVSFSPPAPASLEDALRRHVPPVHPNPPVVDPPVIDPPAIDPPAIEQNSHEQKKEAQLFSYIDGERSEPEEAPRRSFRLGKGTVFTALLLATCAILAAPQAPWHPRMRLVWARGQQMVHGWLNPQLVTTPQAPIAHEDFGRAGDEYKLPVAENIPDATTDPSQIHVVPMVDPTVKKPNNQGANAEQPPAPDPAGTAPSDQPPASGGQGAASPDAAQPVSGTGTGTTSASPAPAQPSSQPTPTQPASTQPASTSPAGPSNTAPPAVAPPSSLLSPISSAPAQPAPQRNPQANNAPVPNNVPSSLKSQMASMTPDASGNKPPEAAMQSIEPVEVPEATERALLTDQSALAYPANATGQSGTVTLQVLIGRDGAVQDAKFLQGSLAFARTAIEGVKQWKFKPYSMNGRPVSVKTLLTINFKPSQ